MSASVSYINLENVPLDYLYYCALIVEFWLV